MFGRRGRAAASLGLVPKGRAASNENMFSITCAQKMAKIRTLPSELETWERRRQEESSKIEERRRHERPKVVFPRGYGPAGKVPKYVEAHLSLLEESPLAIPVLSPGRSACHRRPRSAAASSDVHTKPKRAAAAVSKRPATAHDRRPPKDEWQQLTRRPPSASSPLVLDRPYQVGVALNGRSTLDAGGRVRPATAPCVSSRRRRDSVEERENMDRAREEEAKLVGKMARLSGVQRAGEFPTVAALKTAVALKALEAQLRECRANSLRTNQTSSAARGGNGSGGGGDQKRAASAPVSRNTAAAGEGIPTAPRGRRTSARRRRRGREHHQQRELKPWDNRSPFIPDSVSPGRSTRAPGSPTIPAAPTLRTLTRDDPVFGFVKAPSSTPPPSESRPITAKESQQHRRHGGEKAASSPCADTPVPQETQVQACFRRLTVDALVELSHLRNPPKPVLAVLAGLGCLLGWKQDKKGRSLRLSSSSKNQDRQHQPPRSLFGNVYVLRGVLASVRPGRIPSRRLSAIVARLGVPEAEPAKVRSANAAAWALLEWLLSVVDGARSAGGDGA